jgi:esterase/lipase superfamily enzyme
MTMRHNPCMDAGKPCPRSWTVWVAGLCLVLLVGCQRPVTLMPTPVIFSSGVVDPFAGVPDDQRRTGLSVLYATNREVLLEKQMPVYTIFPSDRLRLGIAHFDVGKSGLSWAELEQLSTSADAHKRPALRLNRIDSLAEYRPGERVEDAPDVQDFLNRINRALVHSQRKEIVIYVHGANNAMHRGMAQAAQFRHFAGRNVVVLSFIWPSAERLRTYAMDIRHARESQPKFAQLVALLAEHTEAKKIDVLAYSAGATVATGGLALLGAPRAGESRAEQRARLRLGVIYYAAPDADTRRFVDDLQKYIDLAENVTVTANMSDATLRLAQRHQGASRIGRPDPTELNETQAHFLVQASQRMGFDLLKLDPVVIPGLWRQAHTYWQTDPWISSDMFTLFSRRSAPAQRGLEPLALPGGGRVWQFPADYDQRIVRILHAPPH